MSSEKTSAIIIKTVDFSESSCIATLFTRDFGKISAIAKGCKRPKSAFESAIDLLAVCRIVFLHKTSDSLDILTEAKLVRKFRASEKSLAHLYAGYYVGELLNEFTDAADKHLHLYDLAELVLNELNDGGDVQRLMLRFELMLLRFLGHLPELAQCVETGRPIPESGKVSFGLLAGGVLSTKARSGHKHVVQVQVATLRLYQTFADPGDQWRDYEIPKNVVGESRAILNRYITHLLGHPLKMHEHLGVLSS
ncbi:MAG: DNA repair protein RecO [Pirellulales bacterium]